MSTPKPKPRPRPRAPKATVSPEATVNVEDVQQGDTHDEQVENYVWKGEQFKTMLETAKHSGAVPLCNLGPLLAGIPVEEGGIPESRVRWKFRLGWAEDTSVERSKHQPQHPLRRPEVEVTPCDVLVERNMPTFMLVPKDLAVAVLAAYGAVSPNDTSHHDHGVREWTAELHELILAAFERNGRVTVDPQRRADELALKGHQQLVDAPSMDSGLDQLKQQFGIEPSTVADVDNPFAAPVT